MVRPPAYTYSIVSDLSRPSVKTAEITQMSTFTVTNEKRTDWILRRFWLKMHLVRFPNCISLFSFCSLIIEFSDIAICNKWTGNEYFFRNPLHSLVNLLCWCNEKQACLLLAEINIMLQQTFNMNKPELRNCRCATSNNSYTTNIHNISWSLFTGAALTQVMMK